MEGDLILSEDTMVDIDFPIIGIGASAGGLEAFEQFFSNMPPDTGMAFVLIPHLDPHHKSSLAELIKRYTRMNVLEVKRQGRAPYALCVVCGKFL